MLRRVPCALLRTPAAARVLVHECTLNEPCRDNSSSTPVKSHFIISYYHHRHVRIPRPVFLEERGVLSKQLHLLDMTVSASRSYNIIHLHCSRGRCSTISQHPFFVTHRRVTLCHPDQTVCSYELSVRVTACLSVLRVVAGRAQTAG